MIIYNSFHNRQHYGRQFEKKISFWQTIFSKPVRVTNADALIEETDDMDDCICFK